jgi:hypothetical protein
MKAELDMTKPDLLKIRRLDGRTVVAFLLSRAEDCIRVRIAGSSDATEFRKIKEDMWASEDCEPARVAFPWDASCEVPVVQVNGETCSPAVREQFLELLFQGDPRAFEVLTCSSTFDHIDPDDGETVTGNVWTVG